MDKFLRSIGIVAGFGFLSIPAQALQVVEWGGPTPLTGGAERGGLIRVASQHGGATLQWDRFGASWDEAPAPLPPLAAVPPAAVETGWHGASAPDRGSPLLAGLGAIAVLMWRRLRRH